MSGSIRALLTAIKDRLCIFCGQHRACRELMRLSDHALADIGLSREEFPPIGLLDIRDGRAQLRLRSTIHPLRAARLTA
ncbi:MAG: DUF1127 domain-containing protein [Alphaproteobacteria bacterium]